MVAYGSGHEQSEAVHGPSEQILTKRTRVLLGSVLTLAMAAAAFVSLDIMNGWIGDWGGPLWLFAAFFFPFLAGAAWGRSGAGRAGRAGGALIGAAIVLAPGIGYAVLRDPDLADLRLPLLWSVFTPLAMAQGAVALPAGTLGRKRRSS